MSRQLLLRGTYGSEKTKCNIFALEESNGTWYCVEGSTNVNYTYEDITDGVDVETIQDEDVFTWSSGINSLDELQEAVEG